MWGWLNWLKPKFQIKLLLKLAELAFSMLPNHHSPFFCSFSLLPISKTVKILSIGTLAKVPKSVEVPIAGTFTGVPIVGIFTDFGIGTDTGTRNLRCRYRYRYRNTDNFFVSFKYRYRNTGCPNPSNAHPWNLGHLKPKTLLTLAVISELWQRLCFYPTAHFKPRQPDLT